MLCTSKQIKGLLMLALMPCIQRLTSTSHPAACDTPLTGLSLNSANNPVSISVRPEALLLR